MEVGEQNKITIFYIKVRKNINKINDTLLQIIFLPYKYKYEITYKKENSSKIRFYILQVRRRNGKTNNKRREHETIYPSH